MKLKPKLLVAIADQDRRRRQALLLCVVQDDLRMVRPPFVVGVDGRGARDDSS